jgi:hypothetical protein
MAATTAVDALRVTQLAPEEAGRARQRVAAGRACRRGHLAAVLRHALDDAYFAHEVHEEEHCQQQKKQGKSVRKDRDIAMKNPWQLMEPRLY